MNRREASATAAPSRAAKGNPSPIEERVPPAATANAATSKVSIWVKLFVAFHVIAITIWAIPDPPKEMLNPQKPWHLSFASLPAFARSLNFGFRILNRNELRPSPIKFYVLPTGFWQYWDMFAPDPASTDSWCDALVTYKDGTVKTYQYPRMYLLPIPEKYVEERFRKFYERAGSDDHQSLWPQFAERIAFLSMTNPANPPVMVVLRRHWQDIAPPGKPKVKGYKSSAYFKWVVNQNQLEEMEKGIFHG